MADGARRAEIEAVAPAEVAAGVAVLRAMLGEVLGTDEEVRDMALGVLLGAARVRDARGDDEAAVAEIVRRLRYSDGLAPDAAVREIADWIESQFPAARSPPGEDHERLCDDDTLVQRAARALARCSPPALDLPWDDLPTADRAPYEDAAIAVLMELGDVLSRVSAPKADENQEASKNDERRH